MTSGKKYENTNVTDEKRGRNKMFMIRTKSLKAGSTVPGVDENPRVL